MSAYRHLEDFLIKYLAYICAFLLNDEVKPVLAFLQYVRNNSPPVNNSKLDKPLIYRNHEDIENLVMLTLLLKIILGKCKYKRKN